MAVVSEIARTHFAINNAPVGVGASKGRAVVDNGRPGPGGYAYRNAAASNAQDCYADAGSRDAEDGDRRKAVRYL
jgi:hypothetical protein